MINAVIVGYGKMGKQLEHMMIEDETIKCVGIVDPFIEPQNENMSKDLSDLLHDFKSRKQNVDVVIDFSHPDNLNMIVESMKTHPLPLILATTGFTDKQLAEIDQMGKHIPMVFASNYSLGITVMKKVVKDLKDALGDGFDIELIEKHHNQKVDAPSGTAKTLLQALDPTEEYELVHGRQGFGKRGKEIGVHAFRGGTIAGEHTVIFAGDNEILEITHKADSRQIFAAGAIRAAKFIVGKKPGIYDMTQVLFG